MVNEVLEASLRGVREGYAEGGYDEKTKIFLENILYATHDYAGDKYELDFDENEVALGSDEKIQFVLDLDDFVRTFITKFMAVVDAAG